MSTVTGFLKDVTGFSMDAAAATLTFTLNDVGIRAHDATIVSARPETVTTSPTGAFVVELSTTDRMIGDHFYRITITYLNGAGVPIGFEQVPTELRVPVDGGDITTMLLLSPGALHLFWSATEPDPFPIGAYWANTTTGIINQRIG